MISPFSSRLETSPSASLPKRLFQAEIFPTAIRATAAGSAYGISRLSSAAMPFVLLPILNRYGAGAMSAAIAAAMAIVIVDIAALAPSTTGRALEAIQSW
jgi:MFS transporter, putative metabolite:H+ symporter